VRIGVTGRSGHLGEAPVRELRAAGPGPSWTVEPRYDFRRALELLREGAPRSPPAAVVVGAKGYHPEPIGPYTTRERVSAGTTGARDDA
jgi:hypothetical protein